MCVLLWCHILIHPSWKASSAHWKQMGLSWQQQPCRAVGVLNRPTVVPMLLKVWSESITCTVAPSPILLNCAHFGTIRIQYLHLHACGYCICGLPSQWSQPCFYTNRCPEIVLPCEPWLTGWQPSSGRLWILSSFIFYSELSLGPGRQMIHYSCLSLLN